MNQRTKTVTRSRKPKTKSKIESKTRGIRRKLGRPTKLTKRLKDSLFKALKDGVSYETACEFAGIWPSTFYKWISEGERDKENNFKTEFSEFSEDIKKVNATVEIDLIQQVSKDKSWQSKAWILERRFPDKWGRKERVEGEIKHDHTHTVDIKAVREIYANMPEEQFLDAVKRARKVLQSGTKDKLN